MVIEADLARAIANNEFVLYYHPGISLCDRKLVGFEALVRWNHPERGLLGPAEFLAMAEASRLAIPLGRWILNEACRQMALWHKALPTNPRLAISVNTSFQYLADPCLLRDVRRIIAKAGLFPGSLRLEMTERSITALGATAGATLRQLKAMQIGLEIDDFGTGPDSLGYLRNLPFDTLKIDRSFVKQLGTRNDSSEIIHAILRFMGSLGMQVSAEGVETQYQLNMLKDLGCHRGQGYYFSKPVDAVRAQALIQDETRKVNIHLV
jgi:EAL domain-containing protein (putative c-di-GMP-specific phosphodiesterase class I)